MAEIPFRPEELGLTPEGPLAKATQGPLMRGKEGGKLAVYEMRDPQGRHVANRHVETKGHNGGRRENIKTFLIDADGKEVKGRKPYQVKELIYDQREGGRVVEGTLFDREGEPAHTIRLVDTTSEYFPFALPLDVAEVYVIRSKGRGYVRFDPEYPEILEAVDARDGVNRVYTEQRLRVTWPKRFADLFDKPVVELLYQINNRDFGSGDQPAYQETRHLTTKAYATYGDWKNLPTRQEEIITTRNSETATDITYSVETVFDRFSVQKAVGVTRKSVSKRYDKTEEGKRGNNPVEVITEEETRQRVKGGKSVGIHRWVQRVEPTGALKTTEDTVRETTFDKAGREIRLECTDSLAERNATTETKYKGSKPIECKVEDRQTDTVYVFTAIGEGEPMPPSEIREQWCRDFGWSDTYAFNWRKEPRRYRLSSSST